MEIERCERAPFQNSRLKSRRNRTKSELPQLAAWVLLHNSWHMVERLVPLVLFHPVKNCGEAGRRQPQCNYIVYSTEAYPMRGKEA